MKRVVGPPIAIAATTRPSERRTGAETPEAPSSRSPWVTAKPALRRPYRGRRGAAWRSRPPCGDSTGDLVDHRRIDRQHRRIAEQHLRRGPTPQRHATSRRRSCAGRSTCPGLARDRPASGRRGCTGWPSPRCRRPACPSPDADGRRDLHVALLNRDQRRKPGPIAYCPGPIAATRPRCSSVVTSRSTVVFGSPLAAVSVGQRPARVLVVEALEQIQRPVHTAYSVSSRQPSNPHCIPTASARHTTVRR